MSINGSCSPDKPPEVSCRCQLHQVLQARVRHSRRQLSLRRQQPYTWVGLPTSSTHALLWNHESRMHNAMTSHLENLNRFRDSIHDILGIFRSKANSFSIDGCAAFHGGNCSSAWNTGGVAIDCVQFCAPELLTLIRGKIFCDEFVHLGKPWFNTTADRDNLRARLYAGVAVITQFHGCPARPHRYSFDHWP